MKKVLAIIVFILLLFNISCLESTHIDDHVSNVKVNSSVTLSRYYLENLVYYQSSDSEIFEINHYTGYGKKAGNVIVYCYDNLTNKLLKEFLVVVKESILTSVEITGESKVKVGDKITLGLSHDGDSTNRFVWESSDETVATINNGYLQAVSKGIVTIRAYEKTFTDIYDEIIIYVYDNLEYVKTFEKETNSKVEKDITDSKGSLEEIIEKTSKSVLSLTSYTRYFSSLVKAYEGSVLVYKRLVIENDEEDNSFNKYHYYALTNKHLVENKSSVYVNIQGEDVTCKVISYDKKVNIACVEFESNYYIPTCVFGDSSEVKTGEIVISVGSINKSTLYSSNSLGIVSYSNRYLKDDTDGDGVSDWDSLYIQHDASSTDNFSGGALVNLKGEVIALNTIRINSSKINNMSFSIPSNLILKLIERLENKIEINRYVLNISFIDVKTIINNKESYNIDLKELDYGFYVTNASKNGIGDKNGIKVNDIILSINGIDLYYSYQIREEFDNLYFNDIKECSIEILRNNEKIKLKVEF